MRPRIFIIASIFLGSAAFVFGKQSGWKATLRRELQYYTSRGGPILPEGLVLHMQVHYTVPIKSAKILESHQRDELLAYLSELRKEANPVGELMVSDWIEIVSKGGRGTPRTVSCYHDSKTEEIAVYGYEMPRDPPQGHP